MEPFASASIAQVHKAKLSNGSTVVVKVQHAGIEDTVRNDLEILTTASRSGRTSGAFDKAISTEEYGRGIFGDIAAGTDFGREAGNLHRFTQNFASDELICIPDAHEELSAQRVMTMDFLEGISLTDKGLLVAAGHDLTDLARRGAQMFVDMIFRDGFYHADPHPGNLLVMADGAIGVLDCGMVGRLDDDLREDVKTWCWRRLKATPDKWQLM